MSSNLLQPSGTIAVSATALLINNRWVPSQSGETFATINPSTGEEICQVAAAGAPGVAELALIPYLAIKRGY